MEEKSLILGKGAYGEVFLKNGNAVKQFDGLRHLIQEYTALKYLSDCKYIVNVKNVDYNNLQIEMELYDCNLKTWLFKNKNADVKLKDKIIHDILSGLIELHDRGLCHGDLKPGNILIQNEPLKAVLGDCGFVSISKYTKTNLTTKNYRDPIYERTSAHDMFSFGICLYEFVTNKRLLNKNSYEEYHKVVKKYVNDSFYLEIILSLLNEDKSKRPTSRELMVKLFNKNADILILQDMNKYDGRLSKNETESIRDIIQVIAYQNKINRSRQGCLAVSSFLNKFNIKSEFHIAYTLITLMILSSIFGKTGFNDEKCLSLCCAYKKISKQTFHDIINELLSDIEYISILLLK
jgi:serine/threonine protein kinase